MKRFWKENTCGAPTEPAEPKQDVDDLIFAEERCCVSDR